MWPSFVFFWARIRRHQRDGCASLNSFGLTSGETSSSRCRDATSPIVPPPLTPPFFPQPSISFTSCMTDWPVFTTEDILLSSSHVSPWIGQLRDCQGISMSAENPTSLPAVCRLPFADKLWRMLAVISEINGSSPPETASSFLVVATAGRGEREVDLVPSNFPIPPSARVSMVGGLAALLSRVLASESASRSFETNEPPVAAMAFSWQRPML